MTIDKIKRFLGSINIHPHHKRYTINQDLTVDVNGNVDMSYEYLKEIPIKFGIIYGDFNCSYNELHSLEGSPHTVYGDFNCSYNELHSLEGAPHTIYGNFNYKKQSIEFL